MSAFRLALVQLAVTANKADNLQRAAKLVKTASEKGAHVVGLPECFNSPYGLDYFADNAEEVPTGESCIALAKMAKESSVYVIGGSIPERDQSTNKLFNTCTVWSPGGKMLAKHRKVHLFDINVPGKITFQESAVLSAGSDFTIVSTDMCKIGIGICYDMRFPEMAMAYRDAGCQLLVYPGAFNMTTGPAHWKILQQGRAVDNQLYFASISPARDETASYVAYGHSMVVNPWGKIEAEAEEQETIIYADIDLEYLNTCRENIPLAKQRRNDLYNVALSKNN